MEAIICFAIAVTVVIGSACVLTYQLGRRREAEEACEFLYGEDDDE